MYNGDIWPASRTHIPDITQSYLICRRRISWVAHGLCQLVQEAAYLTDLCVWHVGGGVEVGGASVGGGVGRERRGVCARIVLRLLTHCTINYNIRTQLACYRARLWGSHRTRFCVTQLLFAQVCAICRPLHYSALLAWARLVTYNKTQSREICIQNELHIDNSHANSRLAKRKETNNFTRRTQRNFDI